ncbi:MAG: prepilin-type N-terminal cleavage/methylation domain-containing protein [Planctomycetes bacterium]|nr:prepilin-type N-terminal cleavage/methylation domain-containing protein [Planctomycetota bacterium]
MSGRRRVPATRPRRQPAAGFTLTELLVVVAIFGLLMAIVAPNLGSFVPSAKLDAAAKTLVHQIDFLRSEARIHGKRYELELDLDKARWRRVVPPEEKITTDQDVRTLEPWYENWQTFEDGVQFGGAGDALNGMARHKIYKIVFDENGLTGDQAIVLKLADEPNLVWTILLRGLTGRATIETDTQGHERRLDDIREGAF